MFLEKKKEKKLVTLFESVLKAMDTEKTMQKRNEQLKTLF